jgi:hypothetical protein
LVIRLLEEEQQQQSQRPHTDIVSVWARVAGVGSAHYAAGAADL